MQPLPFDHGAGQAALLGNLRTNLGTWAVCPECYPAVGSVMHDLAPNETFDPRFLGQVLETTYFDTPGQDLLKARNSKSRYLTLRVRCYAPPRQPGSPSPESEERYAISAKTESEKWRSEVPSEVAEMLLGGPELVTWQDLLPPHLLARIHEIIGDPISLVPWVTVCCRRYAVEDETDRYTLDVDTRTDTGKCLHFGVLEFKSTEPSVLPPPMLQRLGLRPIRLSKFKWAARQG
jgi:hypothetical protein